MAFPKSPVDSNYACGTVDPKNHTATLGGAALPIWDNLVIEKADPETITAVVAATGRTERFIKGDRNWIVRITFQHSSPYNWFFHEIHAQDLAGDLSFLSLNITDLKGTTRFFSQSAFIQGPPAMEISNSEASGREWMIYCCGVPDNPGGN